MKQRRLSFYDSQGAEVAAILTEPEEKSGGAVVLCHGFLSTKESRTNRRLTELLIERGIATCCMDWFGMGESDGELADLTVGRCCDQLHRAIAFTRDHGYGRVGIIGSSFGGLIAILVAGQRPGLTALGLKCPVPDFPEVLRLQFGETAMAQWRETDSIPDVTGQGPPISLRYTFFEECRTHDAFGQAGRIQAPTLIVHGDQDELVPINQIRRLQEVLGSQGELRLLQGANHHFGQPEDFRKMTSLLASWMATHLESTRSPIP